MTPTETVAFLRNYNVWRRGNLDDQPMPDPREIGEAIDAAVAMIDRLEAAENAWKISDKTVYDLTEKVIPNIQEKLEAAEKELVEIRHGAAVANDTIKALRTKIEQMERQKPVGEIVAFGESLHEVSWNRGKLPPLGAKIYALPGAKGEEK